MISQLQSFTHNSSEFLRREQDLLLHGSGLPTLRTAMAGRPVVVVTDPRELAARRKDLKPFLREQRPVLVGVDAGADALLAAGHQPHVVVVTASARPAQREGRPRGPGRRRSSSSRGAPGRRGDASSGSAPARYASRPRPPPRTPPCYWPTPPRPA